MVNLPQKQGEDVMGVEQASGNIHESEYTPVDSPLREGNTSRSDEGSSETHELMDTGEDRMKLIQDLKARCTKLEEDVLGLQKRTTKHGAKIKRLKLRVRYLEGRQRSRKAQFRRFKKAGTAHRVSSSKATSLEDVPKQVRNESRVSGEETTNAEGACADMHVDMDIGIDSDDNVDDDYLVADKGGYEAVLEDINKEKVVETTTSLGETAATSNVEEMAKVVQ